MSKKPGINCTGALIRSLGAGSRPRQKNRATVVLRRVDRKFPTRLPPIVLAAPGLFEARKLAVWLETAVCLVKSGEKQRNNHRAVHWQVINLSVQPEYYNPASKLRGKTLEGVCEEVAMLDASEKNRFIEIWRGIAVLVVVHFHFTGRLPSEALGSATPASFGNDIGKIGVYIFFVISG